VRETAAVAIGADAQFESRVSSSPVRSAPASEHELKATTEPMPRSALCALIYTASISDLPERLAAREPRTADEAAQADQALHLLVAREGARVRYAAELALHLDANGRLDTPEGAAAAAQGLGAGLQADLALAAAAGVACHAPEALVVADEAVVPATARVADGDLVVVESIAVAAAAHRV